MKTCKVCNKTKKITEFSHHNSTADGRHTMCKNCVSAYNKAYREKNIEKIREKDRVYAATNAEQARIRTRIWNTANKDRKSLADHQRYLKYKSEGRTNEYYGNVDKEAIKRRSAQWKKDNPGRVAAYLARRRAAMKKATTAWTEFKQIELLYIEAARLTKETEIEHQVDHIVPLCSDVVCGLHVLSNLRIVTSEENNRKKCKLDESLL